MEQWKKKNAKRLYLEIFRLRNSPIIKNNYTKN